jgi:rubrerythrin
MSKNTSQWLSEVKSSNKKLLHWLERQYIGEALAADRIEALSESQKGTGNEKILERIASDERKHSSWIASLLLARNIPVPVPTYEGTRYWEPILSELNTFEKICGAGHHAEKMRLVRIKALANDSEIDSDIREVFLKILPDEEMHSKAFGALSTVKDIEETKFFHERGLEVLGLEL